MAAHYQKRQQPVTEMNSAYLFVFPTQAHEIKNQTADIKAQMCPFWERSMKEKYSTKKNLLSYNNTIS